MPIKAVNKVHERAADAAALFLRRYREESAALSDDIRDAYAELLPEYRKELQRIFLDASITKINKANVSQQVWDFFKAASTGVVPVLTDSFRELTAAGDEAAGDIMTDSLTAGMDDGYVLGLWALEEGGLDEEMIMHEAQPSPDAADAANLTALLAIGGVSYLSRLRDWTDTYTSKAEKWMRGAIFTESTLAETLTPLDYIGSTLVNRIVALGQDELYRAYTIGQKVAWQNFPGFVAGSLWLTAEDERVCPICLFLDFKITWQEPIKDTHPNCRCYKVPIVVDAAGNLTDPSGTPIEYGQFRTRFLGRR